MPLVPLYGHHGLRSRLLASLERGSLPASLLFHGPRGIGKQKLALWLGEAILCSGKSRPCGDCQQCRYSRELTHPDLHWYFPRPRLKAADASPEDVRADFVDAVRDRIEEHGLYGAPGGTDALYVATVRAISGQTALAPALARRKVFVIGDAERMVPQEGSEQAANAFLKVLEEPPADTTIILTSSEPGALLPTVRSRAVAVRMRALSDADMRAFLADPLVALKVEEDASALEKRLALANGAPGLLFDNEPRRKALTAARRLVDAAVSRNESSRHHAALTVAAAGARGAFSDTLDAMLILLRERAHAAVRDNDDRAAQGAARAAQAILQAKLHATGNVNPQLLTARLLRELNGLLA